MAGRPVDHPDGMPRLRLGRPVERTAIPAGQFVGEMAMLFDVLYYFAPPEAKMTGRGWFQSQLMPSR